MRVLQEAGEINVDAIQQASEIQGTGTSILAKRGRKNNWTDAVEKCERIDYSTFDSNIFNSKFLAHLIIVN